MYRELKVVVEKRKPITTLTSIPGVGAATATAFVATIDTPDRFQNGEQIASYLGLVPRIYQSVETHYQGRITQEGDKLPRWLLVEAAHILLTRTKGEFALKQWGLKLQKTKGVGKARVAVARKLCCLMWELWRK